MKKSHNSDEITAKIKDQEEEEKEEKEVKEEKENLILTKLVAKLSR